MFSELSHQLNSSIVSAESSRGLYLCVQFCLFGQHATTHRGMNAGAVRQRHGRVHLRHEAERLRAEGPQREGE